MTCIAVEMAELEALAHARGQLFERRLEVLHALGVQHLVEGVGPGVRGLDSGLGAVVVHGQQGVEGGGAQGGGRLAGVGVAVGVVVEISHDRGHPGVEGGFETKSLHTPIDPNHGFLDQVIHVIVSRQGPGQLADVRLVVLEEPLEVALGIVSLLDPLHHLEGPIRVFVSASARGLVGVLGGVGAHRRFFGRWGANEVIGAVIRGVAVVVSDSSRAGVRAHASP